ncbi:MAG: hypothetical protein ACXVYU_03945 [Oryzihumus sp.]
MTSMRRLSAIAAAGLTTACLVGATPWVAQAHTLDTGVRVAAAIPAEDPSLPTPTDTPTDTTTPTPTDTATDTPTDTGTSSSSTTTEPPTDGGGITITATLPSLPGLPGDNGNHNGNGNGNGGSVPTGGLGGGNAGADGAVQDGACGGLLCAGSSYQNAVGAQDPARAQSSAQSSNPVLAYTGANIVPLLSLAAALLLLGIGTLVVRSRLQAAHQRRH